MDLSTFKLGWRPNQYFAAPKSFASAAKPHGTVPIFEIGVDQLAAAFRAVALAHPRVNVAGEDSTRRQVDFVQRSALFKFPDTITVQFVEQGPGRSSLAIYSRATYGIGDMGVNKKRVEAWLAALAQKVVAA